MAKKESAQVQGTADSNQIAIAVPSFSMGAMPQFDARELPDNALAKAVNCCYLRRRLFLGRPGLVQLETTGLTGTVLALARSRGANYAMTTTMVRDLTTGNTVMSGTFTSGHLLTLLKWLIICAGDATYAYRSDKGLYLCGSLYEGETGTPEVASGSPDFTLTDGDAIGVRFSSASYKRKISYVHATLARASGGSITGHVAAVLYYGSLPVAISTNSVLGSALLETPARYMFTFDDAEVPEGSGATSYRIAIASTVNVDVYLWEGAGEYLEGTPQFFNGTTWSNTGKHIRMSVNGLYRPNATYGIVAKERLFLACGSRIYYSAPNSPFDYSYAGGYFTFGDDDGAIARGLYYDDDRLYVSGLSRGNRCTIVYVIPTLASLSEKTTFDVGAVCKGGVLSYNDIIYILDRFVAAVVPTDRTDVEYIQDVSFMAISKIRDSGCAIMDTRRGWFMVLPGTGPVVHVMSLMRVASEAGAAAGGPWTSFVFPVTVASLHYVNSTVYLSDSDGKIYYLEDDAKSDLGAEDGIEAYFCTKRFDFSSPHLLKTIRLLRLECNAPEPCRIRVEFIGDEKRLAETTSFLEETVNVRTRLRARTLQVKVGTPERASPTKKIWIGSMLIGCTVSGVDPV